MTENKRFTYENHKVNDTLTGDVHSSNRVSVNVLNELHEENEELKKENEYLQQKIEDLNYENIEIIHDKMFLEEKLDDIEKELKND